MAAVEHVTCCIAGGGPAGMMLGFLLARAGVDVLVLEKHPDFLRDFRGDTVHPSTLRIMDELGLGQDFLGLPHRKTPTITAETDDGRFTLADFRRLRGWHPYVVFMPQWDFLNFLVERAEALPGFSLRMEANVLGVVEQRGRVAGVRYRDRAGEIREVRSELVVAADGRDSTVRRSAAMRPREYGAEIDVLWFRVSRRPDDPENAFGRLSPGRLLVLIDRGAYWQAGYVISKGGYDRVRAGGIDAFRSALAQLAPFLGDRVAEIPDWDQVRLLRVKVNRLRRWWRPGLLCISDAAHAMSPVGGVGINLAIQDATAAANLLARPLREGSARPVDLARVQLRRAAPTIVTQWIQRAIQRRFLERVLIGRAGTATPRPLALLARFPALQVVAARAIGVGLLPERVRTGTAGPRSRGGGRRQ